MSQDQEDLACRIDVGRVIKQLLQQKNITPYKLASDCGLPRSTVYSLLTDDPEKVKLSVLRTISDYFGVGVQIFFDPDHYEQPVELSPDERKLLFLFRSLNEKGKMRIGEYLEDICSMEKFRM